jgi:hypothetical protein
MGIMWLSGQVVQVRNVHKIAFAVA